MFTCHGKFSFHLREISTLNVTKQWDKDLYLFGRTVDNKSVTVKVDGFLPYFYTDVPKSGKIEGMLDELNDGMRAWSSAPDAIMGHSIVTQTTLLGYVPGEAYYIDRGNFKGERAVNEYLKLSFRNISDIGKAAKLIRATRLYVNEKETQILEVYHDDWEQSTMFLHQHNLRMQSWVRVNQSMVSTDFTTSDLDRIVHCSEITMIKNPPVVSPISPILQCQFRIRAESAKSTPDNLLQPNASNLQDRISDIAVVYRWIGEGSDPVSITYDDTDEKAILKRFFHDVRKHDPDCFTFMSDNCHDLSYIATRANLLHVDLSLSRFIAERVKPYQHKKDDGGKYDINIGGAVSGESWVAHAGRSRCDLKPVIMGISKMLKKKLKQFTLNHAIFHSKITKGKPPESMWKHSFLGSQFLTKEQRQTELWLEMVWMNSIETDGGSKINNAVEHSKACDAQITRMIEGGEVKRVWKTMGRYFHEGRIVANKNQLNVGPYRVPINNSSFRPANHIVCHPCNNDEIFAGYTREDPPYYPQRFDTEEKIACDLARPQVFASVSNIGKKGRKRLRTVFGTVIDEPENINTKKAAKRGKNDIGGGHVEPPIPGCYKDPSTATFTFDFSSLYPSIIRASRVCFMRILFPEQKHLLDDPDFELEYVPINANDCIVMVKSYKGVGVQTVLPEITDAACKERTRVKNAMNDKSLTKFEYQALNAKQMACKVFQNAIYGFLGDTLVRVFPVPVIMGTVTAIGRWMILRVRHDMIHTFYGHVVYGDTDSMMSQFPHPPWLTTRDDIVGYYDRLMPIIEKHFASVFTFPNKLIFETMKLPFILYKKKNYSSIEFEPGNLFSLERDICAKGLGFSKLDRGLFVCRMGDKALWCIHHDKLDEFMPFVRDQLDLLIEDKIPYTDLSATTVMRRDDAYSNENLIQCFTAAKITERTGKVIDAGFRLEFVVIEGSDPHHLRGEPVKYAADNKLKIDKAYFLKKKLNNAIAVLLTHHPTLNAEFEAYVDQCFIIVTRKANHMNTLSASMATAIKRRNRKQKALGTNPSDTVQVDTQLKTVGVVGGRHVVRKPKPTTNKPKPTINKPPIQLSITEAITRANAKRQKRELKKQTANH